MFFISGIRAREVLDSKGHPTVEVDVETDGGVFGRSIVASGRSLGSKEARQLRDRDPARFRGRGVLQAVDRVNNTIASSSIIGMDVRNQRGIDDALIRLDSTPDKSRLGSNAVLGVSMACAQAAAEALQLPLYVHIGGVACSRIPVPLVNVFNGGQLADNNMDIQEFLIIPAGFPSFREAIRACCEVFEGVRSLLQTQGVHCGVGDEGGFSPDIASNEAALETVIESIREAGYEMGKHFFLGLDVAANTLFDAKSATYRIRIQEERDHPAVERHLSSQELVEYYIRLVERFPFVRSLEDPMHEDDWEGFQMLTKAMGDRVQIVGDNLFASNQKYLLRGIRDNAANAILVHPGHLGTLTETLDTIALAREYGYSTILSHRSADSDDASIADLAVAVHAGQIKAGAVCRGECTAKYNQLIRIEEQLSHPQYRWRRSLLQT
jgi:enolase